MKRNRNEIIETITNTYTHSQTLVHLYLLYSIYQKKPVMCQKNPFHSVAGGGESPSSVS